MSYRNGERPECENHARGRCPRSDVVLLAEHGTPQAASYWTFKCRTCKLMFMRFDPLFVDAVRKKQVDLEIGNLVNDRFKGFGK